MLRLPIVLLFVIAVLLAASSAGAAPVLRAARVQVTFTGPTACSVEAAYTVEMDAPAPLDHRLEARQGTRIAGLAVDGQAVASSVIGTTQSFPVPLASAGVHTYRVDYTVEQPERWVFRCPLALPAVPADGISREVELTVALPDSATPGGSSLPAFDWSGGRGLATLPHVPAFVRVPFSAPGAGRFAPGINLNVVMDTTAVGIIAGATLFWFWRKRR